MTATHRPARPTSCPHCGARPADLVAHLRDAGDTSPARAAELGYCPELAKKRTASTFPLLADDRRIASKEDRYLASIDPRQAEEDYREALARAMSSEAFA